MIRRIVSMAFAITLIIALNATSVFAQIEYPYVSAKLNQVEMMVDGELKTVTAYNIDGYNYFKIRDICEALNFLVEWDNTLQAVWVETTKPYDNSAKPESAPLMEITNTMLENKTIFINALDSYVSGCNIGGYNYFKLRDLADLSYKSTLEKVNKDAPYITVDWNGEQNLIVIKKQFQGKENENPTPNGNEAPPSEPEPSSETAITYTEEEFADEIIRLVNIEREKAGVTPVEANVQLMEIAGLKAQEMAELNYHSHVSPNYGSPSDFAKHFGYSTEVAENIHSNANNVTSQEVFSSLFNSDGHRKVMLNPNYKYIGVGNDNNTSIYFYVQLFSW